jgi:hypothetical protein
MPLNKALPYGESLGGVTHGFPVQGGYTWHPSGEYPVDSSGKKLAEQKTSAPAAKTAAAKPEGGVLADELKE